MPVLNWLQIWLWYRNCIIFINYLLLLMTKILSNDWDVPSRYMYIYMDLEHLLSVCTFRLGEFCSNSSYYILSDGKDLISIAQPRLIKWFSEPKYHRLYHLTLLDAKKMKFYFLTTKSSVRVMLLINRQDLSLCHKTTSRTCMKHLQVSTGMINAHFSGT